MTHAITDVMALISMDPGAFAPTSPTEISLMQQKKWTKTFRNELAYTFIAKTFRLTFFKT